MTLDELKSAVCPFKVVLKAKGKKKRKGIIVSFSKNDPIGVGGGLFPNMPTAYFERRGWLLVDDLIRNYDLDS